MKTNSKAPSTLKPGCIAQLALDLWTTYPDGELLELPQDTYVTIHEVDNELLASPIVGPGCGGALIIPIRTGEFYTYN